MIMGDKGGKKDKRKSEQQSTDKNRQKENAKSVKQQKDSSIKIGPKK